MNKHKVLLWSENALQIEISHKHFHLLEFKHIDKDSLSFVKRDLNKLLLLNPYDDETYHNLGWVHFALENKDSTNICFKKALQLRPYNSTYLISAILNDLRNSNKKLITAKLSKAIRYSPDVLESTFYNELSIKHPKISLLAEEKAISGLKDFLKENNNPILKARLARLLLEKDPVNSIKLFEEVTVSLPNLSRPWLYKAFLQGKLGDTILTKKSFDKSIFLRKGDFLSKLYYAKFLQSIKNSKESVKYYKEALQAYGLITSENYRRNKEISNLETIRNSYIPNNLLYYTKPEIPYTDIFNYFVSYYKRINDLELQEFYKDLSKKYESQSYKGNEFLR